MTVFCAATLGTFFFAIHAGAKELSYSFLVLYDVSKEMMSTSHFVLILKDRLL